MLIQPCTLEEHRLVVPISVTKHSFENSDLDTYSAADTSSFVEYRGLIDTGATRTVLSEKIIAEQQLMRIGHMQFSSMHGPETHTKYLASIGFWAERRDHFVESIISGNEKTFFLHDQLIEPVNMNDNANFDAIIGFDVLKYYDFKYQKNSRLFELHLS